MPDEEQDSGEAKAVVQLLLLTKIGETEEKLGAKIDLFAHELQQAIIALGNRMTAQETKHEHAIERYREERERQSAAIDACHAAIRIVETAIVSINQKLTPLAESASRRLNMRDAVSLTAVAAAIAAIGKASGLW